MLLLGKLLFIYLHIVIKRNRAFSFIFQWQILSVNQAIRRAWAARAAWWAGPEGRMVRIRRTARRAAARRQTRRANRQQESVSMSRLLREAEEGRVADVADEEVENERG